MESNGSVSHLAKVTLPDAVGDDYFGTSVSLSGDLLAVGARDALAEGNVLADGWNEVTETGFLVSQSFSFKLDDPGALHCAACHYG